MLKKLILLSCILICSILFFFDPCLAGTNDSQLSVSRKIVDKIDKTHTDWVESTLEKYRGEICGGKFAPANKTSFDKIQEKAERISDKCYALANLPQGIGIDFSNYQNITEEIFFDSLIQSKMDQLTCQEYAFDCFNNKQQREKQANDFIDRLEAFTIYREKYQAFRPDEGKIPTFSDSETKILKKYFPDNFGDTKKFLTTWDPISAVGLIVNHTDPNAKMGFQFQEAFAHISQNAEKLEKFEKMRRDEKQIFIRDFLEKKSIRQKSQLQEEKKNWGRSCRPEAHSENDYTNCFYRPTYEQKRKLLDEYALNSLFNNENGTNTPKLKNLDNISKEERAFFCSLNVKYGLGASYFDSKMYNILYGAFFLHPARAVLGAVVSRNLTLSLLSAGINKKYALESISKPVEKFTETAASFQTAVVMKNIYEKCTESKFKTNKNLPFLKDSLDKKRKSRDVLLAECQSCKAHPRASSELDYTCFNEATKWIINNALFQNQVTGNTVLAAKVFAQENNGSTPVSKKVMEISEAVSMFLSNLSLTSSVNITLDPELFDEE